MDTISSRDSNNNYLPLAGVIAGALALVLAIVAFVKITSLKNEIADMQGIKSRVESLEGQIGQISGAAQSASQSANEMRNNLIKHAQEANGAFTQISTEFTSIKERLGKLEAGRPAVRPHTGGTATATDNTPPTPGTDVYTVKPGDYGTTIFRATGFSQAQLEAVNPGINWSKLKVGQKIVLPKK